VADVTTCRTTTRTGTGTGTGTETSSVTVRVTSITSDRMDVSLLRDLVNALDAAGAPQTARVQARSSDIVVEWTRRCPDTPGTADGCAKELDRG
jgi:hypothetical protein